VKKETRDKPSVCFIRTDYGLRTGATSATLILAEALADEGFNVRLLSIFKKMAEPTDLLNASMKHTYLNPAGTRQRHAFFKTTRKLRSYLKDNHIDIVCSVCMSPAVMVLLATMGMNVKRVFIEHSNRSNRVDYNKSDDMFFRMTVKRFDRVVVLTEADIKNYVEMFKTDKKKIRVIPNWIGDKALENSAPYDSAARKLVTVGNVDPVKGYDLLLRVAERARERFSDWQWDIYGGGEGLTDLRVQVEKRGLEDCVVLKGNDPEVLKRYREHSIFVMTSYFEGLPLALLEARANRLPAVAFDCPTGPREVIDDGVDGFLVPCYETEAMVDRLAELMGDSALRTRFSEASAKQVAKFSKDAIFARWLALFDELMKTPPAVPHTER
jgi:glycosyltransferase involved in cell wall biosynthesis